jgi:ribosomal protein L16 Arg81 hydroxylase
MYEFLKDVDFLEARKKQNHFLFKKVLTDVPTWDDILLNVEKSYEENLLIKYLPNFTIITHNGEKYIKSVFDLLQEIKKIDNSVNASAHVYISLTKFGKSFGKHKDNSDVFFWQIIGNTIWKIETEDGIEEYVMEVGDIIYVPRGIFHEVIPLSPRVGISLGLDYGSKHN